MSRSTTTRLKVFKCLVKCHLKEETIQGRMNHHLEYLEYHLEAKVSLLVVSRIYYTLSKTKRGIYYFILKVAKVDSKNGHVTKQIVFILKRAAFRHFGSVWVLSLQNCLPYLYSILAMYIISAMDVVCTENAENKYLVSLYSRTKALLQPSTGRGNSQSQKTCSFEEAHVEFPSRWDLNATVVESEIEREIRKPSDTCQTNAKQMSVTEPERYIEACIAKPELHNKQETPFQASSKFNCLSSGDNLKVANVLDNIRNIQLRNSRAVIVCHSRLRVRREREPSRFPFKITRLFKRRKRTSNQSDYAMCSSPANFITLLETRLCNLDRTAIDVGGGGDCFFRAVSHQLYGTPNNHFYLRSVGVQYLVHNPEQFIESNTEHSWQGYLQRMSNQGTWADAIIIQAVANCLNLSIHIIESNPAFSPVTIE